MRFQQHTRIVSPILGEHQSPAKSRNNEHHLRNGNIFSIENDIKCNDKADTVSNHEENLECPNEDNVGHDKECNGSSNRFVKAIQSSFAKVPSALKCPWMLPTVSILFNNIEIY